jgi:hypothetical protein
MRICQIECFDECSITLTYFEQFRRQIIKKVHIRLLNTRMLLSKIGILRKLYFGLKNFYFNLLKKRMLENKDSYEGEPIPTLNLRPGEKVRIRKFDQIHQTLDINGKYQGLAFTPAQTKYCGGNYVVLKRVEKAFNEKTGKLFKMKDTVLLDNVVCDGQSGMRLEWDGCDRHCLLWWKEIWLERIEKG